MCIRDRDIYNELPIHSFFVTDVANDGMLSGLNISTFESIKKLTDKKITIGGGVKDLSDVKIGIKNSFDHMVIGKAIYENKFSLDELVKLNA